MEEVARRTAEKSVEVSFGALISKAKVTAAKPRGPIHARPIAVVVISTPSPSEVKEVPF